MGSVGSVELSLTQDSVDIGKGLKDSQKDEGNLLLPDYSKEEKNENSQPVS